MPYYAKAVIDIWQRNFFSKPYTQQVTKEPFTVQSHTMSWAYIGINMIER